MQIQRPAVELMILLCTSLKESFKIDIYFCFGLLRPSVEKLRFHGNVIKKVENDRFINMIFSQSGMGKKAHVTEAPLSILYVGRYQTNLQVLWLQVHSS